MGEPLGSKAIVFPGIPTWECQGIQFKRCTDRHQADPCASVSVCCKRPRPSRVLSLHLQSTSISQVLSLSSPKSLPLSEMFSVRLGAVTSAGGWMLSSSIHPPGDFPGQSPSGTCRLEMCSVELDGIQMKSKRKLCRPRLFPALLK